MGTCTGIKKNLQKGNKKGYGYPTMIVLWEQKPTAIAEATASLAATYEAYFMNDKPNRAWALPIDIPEIADSTSVDFEITSGLKLKIGEKQGTSIFKIIADDCTMRSLLSNFKEGREMFAAFVTKGGFIKFMEGLTAGTVDAINVYVSALGQEARPDAPGMVSLNVQPIDDFLEFVVHIEPEAGFNPLRMTSVESLNFAVAGTPTITSVLIDVTGCGCKQITDLPVSTASIFKAYNVTTSSDVPITGTTRSGYRYTVSHAIGVTAGNEVVYYLEAPSTSDLKYEVTQADGLTVNIPI